MRRLQHRCHPRPAPPRARAHGRQPAAGASRRGQPRAQACVSGSTQTLERRRREEPHRHHLCAPCATAAAAAGGWGSRPEVNRGSAQLWRAGLAARNCCLSQLRWVGVWCAGAGGPRGLRAGLPQGVTVRGGAQRPLRPRAIGEEAADGLRGSSSHTVRGGGVVCSFGSRASMLRGGASSGGTYRQRRQHAAGSEQ